MANRTMQAKSLKLRRQRRAWAKPLARSNHTVPNKGVLQDYKERAKGLGVNEAEVDDMIRRYYKREPFSGTGPGRKEVITLLEELRHIVPAMLFFDIFPANCYQRCRCFFNSQKTCYILVHDDYKRGTVRRSIEYPSLERASSLWFREKVTWVNRPMPNSN
jgi:hypothetical protein